MRAALLASIVLNVFMGTAAGAETLRIATWNLEWLLSPATAHASRLACDASRRTTLPCNVARKLRRDSSDFARLAHHARRLDADVVAFQEVENEAIARRVFKGYQICLAPGQGLQHVGFAIRTRLPHRCLPPIDALALGGRLRPAAQLQLFPGSAQTVTLLAVHLKSGCADLERNSDIAACRQLSRQSRMLGEWIKVMLGANQRFIVLGDFNRTGPDDDDPFWQTLQAVGTTQLRSATSAEPFRNCHVGQPFSSYIDHLLLSPALLPQLVAGSVRRQGFGDDEALRYTLSDHCPVSITLRITGP